MLLVRREGDYEGLEGLDVAVVAVTRDPEALSEEALPIQPPSLRYHTH